MFEINYRPKTRCVEVLAHYYNSAITDGYIGSATCDDSSKEEICSTAARIIHEQGRFFKSVEKTYQKVKDLPVNTIHR